LTDTIGYVGLLLGAGLSVAIFSYLLGDNRYTALRSICLSVHWWGILLEL